MISRDIWGIVNKADSDKASRIAGLRALLPALGAKPDSGGESNNHIHTCYSFSPYTPAAAAVKAYQAGLDVAGSVDHDSIAAAAEMREACALLGLGCVTGCEIRVSCTSGADGKPGEFSDKKINNPDSKGSMYMTIQGLPESGRAAIDAFLAPIRAHRILRTKKMTLAANKILCNAGVQDIDFDRDILQQSRADEGGGITERHLLSAVSAKILKAFGAGKTLPERLVRCFGISLSEKQKHLLADEHNQYLHYDLLGILKSGFLERIFIQPDNEESVDAKEAVKIALSVGAIPAYAYLGDVAESPTGDKKAEKFEDDFLEPLLFALKKLGFPAITYMPPRNTQAQLSRLRTLCAQFSFMEISGVDINQPRQSFNCPELRLPEFSHLTKSTWAMVAHEALSNVDISLGFFSPANPLAAMHIEDRILLYARAGRALDARNPDSAAAVAEDFAKGRFTQ